MALPVCLGASAAIYFNADFASGKLPNNITVSDEDGLAYAEVYGVELTADQLAAFAEEKNRNYVSLLTGMTQEDVIPGVVELLAWLRAQNIPAAVASSSKNAPLILEKTGLKGYFTVIVDGSQITRSKPDPQVFQKAADALGVGYANCVVVEDAVSGVQAALALGCQVAAVGRAAQSEGVTYPLKKPDDLIRQLSVPVSPDQERKLH